MHSPFVSARPYGFALLMLALLFPSLPACAQEAGAAAPGGAATDAEKVVTRAYDIRDMLLVIRNYPFRGAMFSSRDASAAIAFEPPPRPVNPAAPAPAPGEGAAAVPVPEVPHVETVHERLDSLTQLITETVSPDTWRDAGGSVGSVRSLAGQLIITQTTQNHEQIVQLLTTLRGTRGKMIRVRANWLLMSSAQAEKLFDIAGKGREAALVPVDPAALRGLPQDVVQYQAQTVGFNTQTVHVISGPARTIVSDVDAQVGTGVAAFDPVMELVRSGLVLEVTPLVAADNRYATLDLFTAFVDTARDGRPAPARAFAGPQPAQTGEVIKGAAQGEGGGILAEGVVDRLSTTMQEIRTTVQVPLGQPVLIGGMTLDPALNGQPSPQLYLVVEVVASERP